MLVLDLTRRCGEPHCCKHHRKLERMMMWRMISIIFGVLAVAMLTALLDSPNGQIPEAGVSAPSEAPLPADNSNWERPKQEKSAGEIIGAFDRLSYGAYLIERRHRMAKLDVSDEYGPPPKPVKVSYAVVKRRGRIVARFDADLMFPLGNSSEAGLFDLLNNGHKQLIVSQDIPKTGVQWVADLSANFKVIFDGQKYQVGREGDDMTIADLDGDGVKEIIAPITAFYGFEKWRLTTSDTPLPSIVFKYDRGQHQYLPANPEFKNWLLGDLDAAERDARSADQRFQLGRVMSPVLDYVFAGYEDCGWNFFDEVCTLPDKAQIKADMLKELNVHPVYRYLYRHRISLENQTFSGSPTGLS
jgi:hypothetical protein